MIIDIVFSLDSVITAVGMVDHVTIMIGAKRGRARYHALGRDADFRLCRQTPTIKMLALSFLVLIGTNLVAEGLGQHIAKGYTYFAMVSP